MKLFYVKSGKFVLLVTIPAAVVLLLFLLNLYVKHRIENRLQELDSQITYSALNVNIYLNRYSLEEVKSRQPRFTLDSKEIIFKGASYYSLLFDSELIIDRIEVQDPQLIFYKGKEAEKKNASGKEVKVGEIYLRNGDFSIKENDSTADNQLFLKFPEVSLKFREKNISMNFESYRIQVDSLYLKMNKEHYIKAGSTEAENGKIRISDFAIASFYPKNKFDQVIPYEKDRIDLKVPQITFEGIEYQQTNDTLQLSTTELKISEALLTIYRNKLNADDRRVKPLYNELLRKAPVKLNFEKILIEKSEIVYEELVQETRREAVIRFTQLEGEISSLQNISDSLPQPKFVAQAQFMRGTPISLNLTFPVFDRLNKFHVSGELGEIEGEALDPFLIPAMDVQARGNLKKIDFDFYGNEDILEGNFAMDYENLKVELLQDKGTNKKNVLSALANLLVNNEGEAGGQEKRVKVERNKNRSFWNFLWIGLREGFVQIVKQF